MVEFENAVNYMNLRAEKIVQRFHRYGRIVMNTTRQEAQRKLDHALEQVNQRTVL